MAENTPDTTEPTPVAEPVVADVPTTSTTLEPGWVPERTTTTTGTVAPAPQEVSVPAQNRPNRVVEVFGWIFIALAGLLLLAALIWAGWKLFPVFRDHVWTPLWSCVTRPAAPPVVNNYYNYGDDNSNTNSNNNTGNVGGDNYGNAGIGNVFTKVCGACGKRHKGTCTKGATTTTKKRTSTTPPTTKPPVVKKGTVNPLGDQTLGPTPTKPANPVYIPPTKDAAPPTVPYVPLNVEVNAVSGVIDINTQK